MTAIVWFRDDLRVSDHPALSRSRQITRIGCVAFTCSTTERRAFGRSAARRAGGWRSRCAPCRRACASVAHRWCCGKGSAPAVIAALAREIGAEAVYWNEIAQAPHRAVADQVAAALAEIGVAAHRFPGDLLAAPKPDPQQGEPGPARVHAVLAAGAGAGDPPKPLPAPKTLQGVPNLASDRLEDWKLEPTQPDWAGGLRDTWKPGEASAQARLKAFLDGGIAGYSDDRDRPDRDGTSRLSPHLRFGEISPRQVWHAARFAAAEHPRLSADIDKFLSELGWREFCRHLLFDVPDLATRNLQPSFDAFPWKHDAKALHAWQRGQTGYPIVDAGMRELWHTGVMHNRVRMVVASFLVKHLLIDWRHGEQWFWDTLVDADPGSNPASWQWVAGSGADAAPYFRVFNPILQGEKFDPDGAYVRRWVPELAQLPDKLIHQPWTATPLELASAGVELGKTYPQPIVDHKAGRERALARLTRRSASELGRSTVAGGAIDQQHGGGAGDHAGNRDGIEPLVEQHDRPSATVTAGTR